MAQAFREAITDYLDFELTDGDEYDAAVDFSRPENLEKILAEAEGRPCYIGTTGYTAEQRERLRYREGVMYVPNGSETYRRLMTYSWLWDVMPHPERIDILDIHDVTKKDSPSGSALQLEQMLAPWAPIEIRSERVAGADPSLTVILRGDGERVTIRHEVTDRKVYARGFLDLIRRDLTKA